MKLATALLIIRGLYTSILVDHMTSHMTVLWFYSLVHRLSCLPPQ